MKFIVLSIALAFSPALASASDWVTIDAPSIVTKFDGTIDNVSLSNHTVEVTFYDDSSYEYADGIFRHSGEEPYWTIIGHDTRFNVDFIIRDNCFGTQHDGNRGLELWCDNYPIRYVQGQAMFYDSVTGYTPLDKTE